MDQLLPRVLPTITLVDALLFHERKTVMLFATGKGAKEAFAKLFFETFSLPLEASDPLQRGMRADIGPEQRHALERLEPIRWPNTTRDDITRDDAAPRVAPAPTAQASPGEDAPPWQQDTPAEGADQ